MTQIVDREEYLRLMLEAPRPGGEKFLAFYEHRIGAICTDPALMLLPWDDHIVHRGDGVFEVMKFRQRRIYQVDAHLARMERSSKSIYLNPPMPWDRVREIMVEVCRAADRDNGSLKLMLGRGAGGFGIDPAECPTSSFYIAAYSAASKPETMYEQGATAITSSIPAKQSYIAKIKSMNYLPNMLIKREASDRGVDFAFCFDDKGFLAEGSIENVVLVDASGAVVVPELTNALTGTTLMRALELIKDEVSIFFRPIREEEIYGARELMVLGTTLDALPIVRFNSKPIHDARPGPVARRLRELLTQDLLENGLAF
ncbi:MAG: aminotransferase class IV [Desulfovibrionaceae bacterium]|nr:aminotransferase class IV [Desulfovibrionaceae bacterium]